ncbi:dna polymerase delta small subunit, partial [Quercus suber]
SHSHSVLKPYRLQLFDSVPLAVFPAMEAMEIDSQNILQRKQATYTSLDDTFGIHKETYRGQQYSQIYFTRLHLMRTLLYSLAPNWKPHLPVCTILQLEKDRECIIVGTLYKHMKLKPCILDEYSKEEYNSLDGVVVALLGKETDAGDFLVQDVLEAGLPPQIEHPLKPREDKHVVFVSGLRVGGSTSNPLQFQLLIDHITGHLGDEKEQGIAAEIVHVVLAGNSVEFPRGLLNGQAMH